MRPYGTPQQLETRRQKAVGLLKSGQDYRSVAAKLKCSLSSVVRWQQAYRKEGRKGLQPKPAPGRPCRLSGSEKRKLIRILGKSPLSMGHATDLWTLKRIAQVIRNRFGVFYHVGHVWHLMTSLGWSPQKPQTRDRERDEKAISHWKRYVWPHIKKSQKA